MVLIWLQLFPTNDIAESLAWTLINCCMPLNQDDLQLKIINCPEIKTTYINYINLSQHQDTLILWMCICLRFEVMIGIFGVVHHRGDEILSESDSDVEATVLAHKGLTQELFNKLIKHNTSVSIIGGVRMTG